MKTPYKFVKWDVDTLEKLEGTLIYELFNKRKQLNQHEKDWLLSELVTNSYSKTGIPRAGYMFPFEDILSLYLVKLKYYGWQEIYAPNKTSVRNYYKHSVLKITQQHP